MKRKIVNLFITAVSCLLVLSMLSGCLVEGEKHENNIQPTPQPEPEYLISQIQLSGYRFEERSTCLSDFIHEFNSTYPSVDVTVLHDDVSAEQYFSQLDERVEAGTQGDVFLVDSERMAKYAAEGKIISLDTYLGSLLNFDTFTAIDPSVDILPAAYAASKYGDHIYMAPIEYYHKFVFLNINLIQQAGFTFPADDWSWEDLIGMAEKLKANGVKTPIVMDYKDYTVWGAFARSYGTDIYDYVGNSESVQAMKLTHPNVVRGLTDLAELVKESRGLVKCADASELTAEELANYAFVVADHENIAVWSEYLTSEDCPFEWDYIHFPRWNSVNGQTGTEDEPEEAPEESEEPTETPEPSENPEGDAGDATEAPSGGTSSGTTSALPHDYVQSIGARVYGFAVTNYGKDDVHNDEYYRSCAYLALYAMVDAAAKAYAGDGETVPANKDVVNEKFWREFPVDGKNSSVFSHFSDIADFAGNLSSFMPISSEAELDVGSAIDAYIKGEASMVVLLQRLQDHVNASWIEP